MPSEGGARRLDLKIALYFVCMYKERAFGFGEGASGWQRPPRAHVPTYTFSHSRFVLSLRSQSATLTLLSLTASLLATVRRPPESAGSTSSSIGRRPASVGSPVTTAPRPLRSAWDCSP